MVVMYQSGNCPICNEIYCELFPPAGRNRRYKCPACGEFVLTRTSQSKLKALLNDHPNGQLLLSYVVRKMQVGKPPVLAYRTIKAILENSSLPTLKEQENNLILYLGNNSVPGQEIGSESDFLSVVVGSLTFNGLDFVISHLKESGLLNITITTPYRHMKLTMKGWERYEEIRRGNIDSKKAFMAMPFGYPTLDKVFAHFKSAVAQTGFDLRRIDERPKAGLIDDRLRVEINTSRFLVAELTEENRGAYWEAGFAEGLGRPVIYTCEREHFKKISTHFDTNHHLTVQWELDKIDEALDELKATIRATLPGEAKLQDD
jgi:transposase-like protein